MYKMYSELKKMLLVLLIIVTLGVGLLPSTGQKVAYAQPNTNGAKAATVTWIMNYGLDALTIVLQSFLRQDREVHWRPQQFQDQEDRQQTLIRWDTRSPDVIFENGFEPRANNAPLGSDNANLRGYVTNYRNFGTSIFVSTTRQTYDRSGNPRSWRPYSTYSGTWYRYEIYAPGGIDVNETLGHHRYMGQNEVAFPGGIRPEFIRSVQEWRNGSISNVYINPNFLNPGELEAVQAPNNMELKLWQPKPNQFNIRRNDSDIPDEPMRGSGEEVDDILPYDGPRALPDGEYQIYNRKNNNVLAELSSNQSGSDVLLNTNYGLSTQKWKFVYNSNKKAYKILNVQNSNLALTWQSKTSKKIMGYEDFGNNDQYWKIERTKDGYYKFRSVYDNKTMLGLLKGEASKGNPLYAWEENGAPSQEWIIDPISKEPLPDGQYQIQSSLDSNKVAHLDSNSTVNDKPIQINKNFRTSDDIWNFTYDSTKNAYKITSQNKPELAFAWDSNDTKKIIGATGDWSDQYWVIEQGKDGYYKLRNYKDPKMVLDVPNSNTSNGVQLQAFEDNGTKAQKWNIAPVNHQTIENGEYLIKSGLNQNKLAVLNEDVENVKLYDDRRGSSNYRWKITFNHDKQAYRIVNAKDPSKVFAWKSHSNKNEIIGTSGDWPDQYWYIEPTTDGYLTFRNYKDPKMVLDVPNSITNNGVQLQAFEDKGTKEQKWVLQRWDIPTIEDGSYNISSKLNYKKVIEPYNNKAIISDYNIFSSTRQTWRFEYDSDKKAYKIRNGDVKNLGLYWQGPNLTVAVDNIDSPPDQEEGRKYWYIDYDPQQGAYLIRSTMDSNQVLDLKRSSLEVGNEIISYQPTYNNNQLWNLMPKD